VPDYIQRNAEARARLVDLCRRLNDEQLVRIAFGSWTVSTVLAHMAFWDRVALERWNIFEQERQRPSELPEYLNTVAATDWLTVPPQTAVRSVLEATEALDKKIESLSEEVIAAARPMVNPRMFERFHHREDHISAIEKVI
jgi:uncharacterized damage-inducible protein DinB